MQYNFTMSFHKLVEGNTTPETGSPLSPGRPVWNPNYEESTQEVKKDPTHFSELDPKAMKVNELRQELEARILSPKGLKSQLIARLTKAIKTEADKAEEQEERKITEPEPPTKPEVESKDEEKKKKEEEEKKKQDEREKLAREKRYALPDAPHIVVHPSRVAKSGKFDCTVMSLSLLLDYRPEDTKEHSFEVSLFAELFNEMLMRDFGFNIYRALNAAPERPKEEEKEKDKEKDRKKDHDKKDKEKKDDKDKKEDKDKKDEKDKRDDKEKRDERKNGKKDDRDEKRDDKHSRDKRESSRNEEKEKFEDKEDEDEDEYDDEEDEDSKDSRKDKEKDDKDKKRDNKDKDKKKKEKVKLYTEDPYLLLSFVYFDQTHCGYIFDKDIEELLYTLGLNLSRAQVRKLVQKVVTRDSLHYRKLTDKRIKAEDPKEAEKDKVKDGGKEKVKESANEKENNPPDARETLAALAFGNKRLLPVFTTGSGGSPPSKRARKDTGQEKEKPSTPEGYVMYRGGLLDVEKLMGQLKRSEKARLDTENKMMTLKEDLSELKETAKQSANAVRDLSIELRDHKERLHNTDNDLAKVKISSEMYFSTLKEIQDKIAPVLQANGEVSISSEIVTVKMESVDSVNEEDAASNTELTVKDEGQSKGRWEKVDQIKSEGTEEEIKENNQSEENNTVADKTEGEHIKEQKEEQKDEGAKEVKMDCD